jgi:hypothetical protein
MTFEKWLEAWNESRQSVGLKVLSVHDPRATTARAAWDAALATAAGMHAQVPTTEEAVAAEEALQEMERRKDAAFEERNRVVAALAKAFPSGVARTAIEGWSEDWHGCVYIDLPTGQASWHFHDSQAHLFDGLPAYTKPWDGHTTEQKYERLTAMSPRRSGGRATAVKREGK